MSKQKSLTKDKLKDLQRVIKDVESVYILIYTNPDPDSVASSVALQRLLQHYGLRVDIGYTGMVGRIQNAAMIKSLNLPVKSVDREKLAASDLVAIVDAQPEFFKGFDLPRCDIIIDHHPNKVTQDYPFKDIRSDCLSTSSILTDYLLCEGLSIPKKLATALFYGFQTDSQGQHMRLSPVDEMAFNFLRKKADHNLVSQIELAQYSLNDLDYFSIALVKRRFAKNTLYAHLGPVPYTDVCVQVADFLIRVQEAHWAIVTGTVNDKLIIVFRCDGPLNAGAVAKAAFGEVGSAGGHKSMGRAEVPKQGLPPGISLSQNEQIEWYVLSSLARVEKSFTALLRQVRTKGISKQSGKGLI